MRTASRGLVIALALAACGTARVVQKTPIGGTIELEGDHNKAMEQANEEMAAHCGFSNFTVLFEGAEPLALDNTTATPADSSRTAYRVRYQCDAGIPVGTTPSPPGT